MSKNFSRSEFVCSCGCGTEFDVSESLITKLQLVRNVYGQPIHINSGFRCKERNKAVGGTPSSSHLTGEAADILCDDDRSRHELIYWLHEKFTRVGVYQSHIHIDVSTEKEQEITWLEL